MDENIKKKGEWWKNKYYHKKSAHLPIPTNQASQLLLSFCTLKAKLLRAVCVCEV